MWSALVLGIALAWAPIASAAERRVALVIGNESYARAALANPVNDANAVAAVLERIGFTVTKALNLTRRQTRETVSAYVEAMREGDLSFFYYSGHGVQVKGENYLVPIDFAAEAEADVEDEAYRVGRLLEGLEDKKPRLSVVVLDACRDNPFRSTRSGSRGLTGMNAGEGTLIAFATSPGRTAADGPAGGHGLFTASLLDHLDRPGVEVESLFKSVREDVAKRSDRAQIPWSSSSIVGTFYLAAASVPEIPAESAAAKLMEQSDARRRTREEERKAAEAAQREEELRSAAAAREQETRYQAALEAEYARLDKLDDYPSEDASAAEKASAWTAFLASYPARNGHAERARSRASYWQEQSRVAAVRTPTSSGAAPPQTSANGARFRSLGDGTVLDTQTGLQWAAADNGEDINFASAERYVSALTAAGYSDWRLPTQAEIFGLYDSSNPVQAAKCDQGQSYPPHAPQGFRLTGIWYWASETRVTDHASVSLHNGLRIFTDWSGSACNRVLPVRAGR